MWKYASLERLIQIFVTERGSFRRSPGFSVRRHSDAGRLGIARIPQFSAWCNAVLLRTTSLS